MNLFESLKSAMGLMEAVMESRSISFEEALLLLSDQAGSGC